MRSITALGMSLVAVLSVSAPAFAEPPTPPPAAAPDAPAQAASTDPPPPAATPAAPRKRKPWKEWLAREAPLPVESEAATERIWYGWQTLLVDGLSLSAVAVAASEEEDAIWFGLGLLLVGSPIVHFAHYNISNGFYSLAIRAVSGGLMALGAVVAVGDDSFVDSDGDSETQGTVIAVVGLLGLAAAVVLDASLFGWEQRPKARTVELVMPLVDPARGHYGVGYARSF